MIKALDLLLSGGSKQPSVKRSHKRNCHHSVHFSFCSLNLQDDFCVSANENNLKLVKTQLCKEQSCLQ